MLNLENHKYTRISTRIRISNRKIIIPKWSSLSFQDRNSPIIEQIIFFHDHSIIILIIITILISYLLFCFFKITNFNKFILEGQEIEVIWTIMPLFFLLFIAFPSFKTLYLIEETKTPRFTIKVTGHQWYWSYECPYFKNDTVDEFIINSNLMRLLKTRETLHIPCNILIRAMVSSNDVIHSWAIPSLGVKVDAIPGRLNQTFFLSKRIGVFVGQCSEICGTNHSFIPISIIFLSRKEFIKIFNDKII